MSNPKILERERADRISDLYEQLTEELWEEATIASDETCIACECKGDIRYADNGEPMCYECFERYINDTVRIQDAIFDE